MHLLHMFCIPIYRAQYFFLNSMKRVGLSYSCWTLELDECVFYAPLDLNAISSAHYSKRLPQKMMENKQDKNKSHFLHLRCQPLFIVILQFHPFLVAHCFRVPQRRGSPAMPSGRSNKASSSSLSGSSLEAATAHQRGTCILTQSRSIVLGAKDRNNETLKKRLKRDPV